MTKYRIIGNMTGNSMDAVDLVLTEFDGDKMTDICSYSKPYDETMQRQMEALRAAVYDKTRREIEELSLFGQVHDTYVQGVADCINEMCARFGIDKKSIDAIGFHGKTLDHNPPSKAKQDGTSAYTLQIGSGQMLADLTGIKVVYDFRSDSLMGGYDGAPLVPPHNAHIAATEGDGIYYNGGNTSNFAVVRNGVAVIGSDAGPFNEYVDNFIRQHSALSFDENGQFGQKGCVHDALLQKLYDLGREFYETALPKSGDPAFYHKKEIFDYAAQQDIPFNDVVRTFEHFAAYIAALSLTHIPENIQLPKDLVLFGGGWKNPVVKEAFENLIQGREKVLPEHQNRFATLGKRFTQTPSIRYSNFGTYMEARLFADLARYKLEEKAWEIPEIVTDGKSIVCGIVAEPKTGREIYADKINRAAKGWQQEKL